jgi:hypothetical protein
LFSQNLVSISFNRSLSRSIARYLVQSLVIMRSLRYDGVGRRENAEAAVEKDGRELLRQSLESIAQEAIDEIEKKGDGRVSAVSKEDAAPRLSEQKN